ncbi:MAG TPA: hypothetical protein PKA00_20580 [Saprospiraceae bacterium]|nr:hypothetical protein [Saprospiraceae bacterium]HMQ85319.1 hypothetical protein [Saprospiraceae bacterium]
MKINATYPIFVMGLLVFLYCLARVFWLSMTHDESATVINFVARPVGLILSNDPPSANNHLLNTLLIKAFITIHNTPFWVRLPNLLSVLLYLFFSYKLLRLLFEDQYMQIAGFVLLISNHYLIEYFSLARGYGLSLGFLMAALYGLTHYLQNFRYKYLIGALLAMILAVYSNLTLLNVYVAAIAVLNVAIVFRKGKTKAEKWALWLGANAGLGVSALVLAGLLYWPVKLMLAGGELYYGGDRGFLPDTVKSLVEVYLYGKTYIGANTAQFFFIVVIALGGVGILNGLGRSIYKKENGQEGFYALLLLLMVFSTIAQHELLGTRFLIGRTALCFYPVFVLCVLYVFQWEKAWPKWILFIWVGFSLYHFCRVANLNMTREWWYDRHTEAMLEAVMEDAGEQQPIRIGGHWIFAPTVEYYKQSRQYPIIGPAYNQEVTDSDKFDYFYIEQQDLGKLHPSYQVLKDFGGYYLMKRVGE